MGGERNGTANGERRTAQEPVTEQRRVGKKLMQRRVAAFSVDAPLKGEHEIQRRERECKRQLKTVNAKYNASAEKRRGEKKRREEKRGQGKAFKAAHPQQGKDRNTIS